MATTIKIKNSATPSSTPSSLEQGEMALNVTDGKLFYGSGSGNDVKEFTGGGTTIDTGSFATTGSNTFIGDQIISGNLDVTGSATLTGITYPTADGDNGDIIFTDGAGVLSFGKTTVYASVKNVTGGTLPKGMPVHASSSVGNTNEIIVASASNAATMPATFILAQQLADEEEGLGIVTGFINGVDTSGFQEGQVLYVGENGGYTNVKPTGTNLIQNLGIVTKVAVNGSGFIYGSGRANDTPNLLENYIFFGSGSNQQYQLHISGALDQTVINNITASGNISASGDIFSSKLEITNTSLDDSLLLTTTEDSSTAGPVFTFKRNSSPPADGDYLGQIKFKGENDNNQEVVYAKITGKISDVTDTTEDGLIEFATKKAGSNVINARLTSTDLKLINSTGLEVNGSIQTDSTITAAGNISGSQTGSFAYLELPGFEFDSAAATTELVVGGNISASGDLNVEGSITSSILDTQYRIFDTGSSVLGSNGGSIGDIVKMGGTSTTAGAIYFLKTDGTWGLSNATDTSASTGSLAMALGTNSTTDGMLLRGLTNPFTDPAAGTGQPVYLGVADGRVQASAPSTSGNVVRMIGYQFGTDLIYFNPSNDYIVLS